MKINKQQVLVQIKKNISDHSESFYNVSEPEAEECSFEKIMSLYYFVYRDHFVPLCPSLFLSCYKFLCI